MPPTCTRCNKYGHAADDCGETLAVTDPLVGVSLADALADRIGEARGMKGSDSAVLTTQVFAWFAANRDTLTSIAFTPSREAAGATDDALNQGEMWEMRDFLTPVLLTHFDALLEAARNLGEER